MTRRLLWYTALAGCALLISCSQPQPGSTETTSAEGSQPAAAAGVEPREMDPEKLKQRIDAGEEVFLLDVRRPDEIAEHGAIEGSVNIPMDQLEARLDEVPKDRPVAVY